jgi:hypothetical protein
MISPPVVCRGFDPAEIEGAAGGNVVEAEKKGYRSEEQKRSLEKYVELSPHIGMRSSFQPKTGKHLAREYLPQTDTDSAMKLS